MLIVRNLLFYPAFYIGTAVLVLAAMVGPSLGTRLGPRWVRAVPEMWSRYHRACLRLVGIRIVEQGPRPAGAALYALKHESFFEAIDLLCSLDHPAPFAKQELFDLPGWGRVAGAYGALPVVRSGGASALRAMLAGARARTEAGRPLAIFPEGTRVPHGTRPPLQAGFAGLYKMLGLPVVPVAVNSGPLYHRRWKRPGTITLLFGPPIEPGLPREEIEARVHRAINLLNAPG